MLTPSVSRQSKLGIVLRVTSGNFLEMFDFFLFGFYATDIAAAFSGGQRDSPP
jgi:MHS family citrate/tricarballylate:H+ symporter-like MFS transporter